MKYLLVRSSNADRLTEKVNQYIAEGYKPIGSHQAVVKHEQNRFRGNQHADTINELEYTQTMVREGE
jgi:hypothetical protein